MRKIAEIKSDKRLQILESGFDGMACYLNDKRYRPPREMTIIASWEEMCRVKDIFWGEDECVVQFHPPKSEYVNLHPYCLHLWKKIGEKADLPPKEFV